MKRLRDYHVKTLESPYIGTCTWCACYDVATKTCMVDRTPTSQMSRCALATDPRILVWWDCSAHERAALMCVKIPTFEAGLSYFRHLSLTEDK